MNGAGDMAVGYSASDGTSVFPGIRYAGRLSTDPLNTLPQGEFTMINGGSSSGATRWGDYSAMAVDPVDDCTFWYTAEYMAAAGRRTRVGAFKFPSCVRTISMNNVSHNEGNAGTTAYTLHGVPVGSDRGGDHRELGHRGRLRDDGEQGLQRGERHRHVPVRRHKQPVHDSRQRRRPSSSRTRTSSSTSRTRWGPTSPTVKTRERSSTTTRCLRSRSTTSRASRAASSHSQYTFTIFLFEPGATRPIMVDYDTADGTSPGGRQRLPADIRAGRASLTGDTSENVTVQVNGDVTTSSRTRRSSSTSRIRSTRRLPIPRERGRS